MNLSLRWRTGNPFLAPAEFLHIFPYLKGSGEIYGLIWQDFLTTFRVILLIARAIHPTFLGHGTHF
jgi:hypothetical protein